MAEQKVGPHEFMIIHPEDIERRKRQQEAWRRDETELLFFCAWAAAMAAYLTMVVLVIRNTT
jgi:hypothetical protein